MPNVALECREVAKKFNRGESFDSLRDLIPALLSRGLKGPAEGELRSKEFWALHDVTFQVNRGEALGVIGHNGAGKSTLLKLLSGILKPTRGELKVNGKLSALIEVGAGFHPDLTGRDNVFLNGVILGMARREIRKKFDEIVEFSGLADFIDTPVKRYSSGMYARLGFAVAAHVDPDILLVDEVLSVGDWSYQHKCAEKMKTLLSGGATILFVSHNLRAVASLCPNCLLLQHGRVAMAGSTEEVIGAYLRSEVALVPEHTGAEIVISEMTATAGTDQNLRLKSGDKVTVQVTVRSTIAADNLALHVYVVDGNDYEIFETSTEFLGTGPFALRPGETRQFRVELGLHLARGMYHVGAVIRSRFNANTQYDRRFPGATVYMDGPVGVRGSVNLYPVLL